MDDAEAADGAQCGRGDGRAVGRRATAGVGVMFASNGAVFAALLPWYPLVAERLELTPLAFGFVVAAFAAGAICSSALPAPLIARFGPARVAIAATVLLAAAVLTAALAGSAWLFAVGLFVAGFFDAITDVAQNVAGIRVQDAVRRPILSSMHALWSLGGVAGGALSTAAAAGGAGIGPTIAVAAAVGVALVTTGALLTGRVAANPPVPASPKDGRGPGGTGAPARGGRFRRVAVLALPLVVIAVCGTMVEDVANNWAAMSGVELAGLPAQVAGIAFTVVIGSQCIGRFTGDLLIHRLGRATVGRVGGALIAVGGLTLVSTTGAAAQLFIGLALIGLGSATLVPSAMSAAATLPGISEGAGVTLVSWLMRVGFLATSPIVGGLTDAVGLRWALGLLVVVGATAAVLAGALGNGERRGEAPDGDS